MKDIFSRIKEIINYNGISNNEFGRNIGCSSAQITQMLTHEKNFGIDKLLKILSAYPELSSDWLLTGNGPMLRKTNRTSENIINPSEASQGADSKDKYTNNIDTIQANREKFFSIPLIPFDAVAGFSGEDNPGVRYEDCERYIVPEFEKSGVEFVIRVSGSSMYPKYSNGDILACRKINNILFFQWGKIYVIDSSSQGILVKRIYEDVDNPDHIILVSDNKEKYPPHPMPKSDIRSLSIVLGVIRME
jgi:phage repressor protein C with HTH and peptisase S24 domain